MRQTLLAMSLALALAACNTDNSPPVGQPHEVLLITPDAEVVGKVTVANSETTLFVTAVTQDGWTLDKVRMAVGTELSHIPQTRHGEPISGRFPLRSNPDKGTTEVAWRFPLIVEPGTVLYFAVQADVRKKESKDEDKNDKKDEKDDDDDDDDKNCRKETAWGEGELFPKLKGSMYFTYTVQSSAPPSLAGQYRTHTQEEWGAEPLSDNAAGYLAGNFVATFRLGVTIGTVDGFTARFTTAAAVNAFLPQAGPAAPFDRHWLNPRVLGNSLAGNTLALAINAGVDTHDLDFSPGTLPLQDLVVADPASPFFGISVGEVLSLANQALAGLVDGRFTLDQLDECVLRINQNFQGGTIDQGFVGLP